MKVVCLPFDGAAAQKHGWRKPTDARFETMLGRSSWVDSLFVWFPALWMPLVVDAMREKSFAYNQVVGQLGAVAFIDRTQIVLPEALDFTYKVNGGRLMQGDAARCYSHASMLTGSLLTCKCLPLSSLFFFIWMLHGSTKVVVRAVALLSAKTIGIKSQCHSGN